jgi:Fic family protein
MRMPKKPPGFRTLLDKARENGRIVAIFGAKVGQLPDSKYLHWDRLSYCQPPEDLTQEEWWLGIKQYRSRMYKRVPLLSTANKPFSYCMVDPIPERLHQIDMGCGGTIQMPDQITNPETRDQYYVSSLIEEAITSSQLEGAVATREQAKEMLRSGRPAKDKDEQMILNNFHTMREIRKVKAQSLTRDLVFHLHRIITEGTLSDLSAAARFRRNAENIVVSDTYGEDFHHPPPAAELEQRLEAMCDFANGKTPQGFLHPALRSIILHFWLAYDHPFVDGNGRTARALFYWSMLHHGFWLFEYISISNVILRTPTDYYRAFLYTETDDNDVTYFLLHQLDVIHDAINALHEYIQRKATELRTVEAALRGSMIFNHRQRTLISHALRHPGFHYTIRAHHTSQNVVYQTARSDLHELRDRGLLRAQKVGKTWYFTPTKDLEKKLAALGKKFR